MPKTGEQQPAPEHPFAAFIRILGKGKSSTRSLNRSEARQAFAMILRGETEPVQLGAFLMLLRVKEETSEELAGFVEACRENMLAPPPGLSADLDWSSYAGKKHQHPWFILAILLLAQAENRVFIHGAKGHTPGRLYTEDAMRQLNLPVASNWNEVGIQLEKQCLSYLPLEAFCNPLETLIQLRHLLGLRSPVNTLSRMLNPLRATASLQSIFHPAYARLHLEADHLLGQCRTIVFKGDSGEVEIKPHADTTVHRLSAGEMDQFLLPRTLRNRATSVEAPDVEPLRALWQGKSNDPYGLNASLATAASALMVIRPELDLKSAQQQAARLWKNRDLARLT